MFQMGTGIHNQLLAHHWQCLNRFGTLTVGQWILGPRHHLTVSRKLSWLGGATERHFRKLRPGIEELPWGTLRPEQYPPLLLERARSAWTEAAYNESCTALAFADLQRALLQAQVPIDLIGMASDFVVDEILHIELTSRIAMELGGKDGVTSEGFLLSDERELGWMESSEYAQAARHAVRHEIAEPLAGFGIVLPHDQLQALLV